MATAIDRLQEARRIFGGAVEACQSLREQAAALKQDIAGAQQSAASLHKELDALAAAVADYRKVMSRAWVWIFLCAVAGGFLGALLSQAAVAAWPWLRLK